MVCVSSLNNAAPLLREQDAAGAPARCSAFKRGGMRLRINASRLARTGGSGIGPARLRDGAAGKRQQQHAQRRGVAL